MTFFWFAWMPHSKKIPDDAWWKRLGLGSFLGRHPSGFAVAGLTESTPTTTVQTRYGDPTPWTAPVGHGGIDGMLLKTTTNGLIVDGFLVGTPQVDMLMDVDIDGRNNLHAAGFIGSEFQLPGGGPTIGVQDKRSAFYGVVNLTGGNNSHLVDAYASAGGSSSNGRANAIAVSSSDDVWIGGRLAPTASGNTSLDKPQPRLG